MDDDDDNIDEDEDTGTMLSNTSDFESRTSKNVTARKSRRSSGKGTEAWCGTTNIGLPYVIDFWKNKTPQNTIGIQVWMMSGVNMYRRTHVRVSTDKRSVVLETTLPENATEPKEAFGSYIVGEKYNLEPNAGFLLESVLEIHPKTIARKNSIAKLRKRCPGHKEITLTQRIPLPYKVRHQFSTKDSDSLFFGKKYVPYKDGSIWLHLELLQDNQDDYTADVSETEIDTSHLVTDDSESETQSTRQRTLSSKFDDDMSFETELESEINTDRTFYPVAIPRSPEMNAPKDVTTPSSHCDDKSPAFASSPISTSLTSPASRVSNVQLPRVMTTRRDPMNHRNVLTNLAHMAMAPLVRQLTVKIPDACGVISQYEGAATRSKSVKSARSVKSGRSRRSTTSRKFTKSTGKRKPTNQD